MHRSLVIPLAALLGVLLPFAAVSQIEGEPHEELSLGELEQRLQDIESELGQLAHYSLRTGVGSIGYRSNTYTNSANTEWIQIELGEETAIDQVVLVPTIWRDTEEGYVHDGFPSEFSILGGKAGDAEGEVIASRTAVSRILPRIAPFVVDCPETTVSWIRVVATRLSPRAHDGAFILQLSEILVFSEQENVALRREVKTSSTTPQQTHAWKEGFLVDGFVPYLMNAAYGEQSLPFVGRVTMNGRHSLTVDLEEGFPLSAIRLHAVDQSDTVPQSNSGDFGMPRRIWVEGSNLGDFSDAVTLVDYRWETLFETGPIVMLPFPETRCRYVRLAAFDPFVSVYGETRLPRIGFAEIELLSFGRNVAIEKPIAATFPAENSGRGYAPLTDGHNLYGLILPTRNWMSELARRHVLETEHPMVLAELDDRHASQKAHLSRMSWLAALLAAGILFIFLIDRMVRMRQIARIRERFAADLHDELGANLHAIGLLGDMALSSTHTPERLRTVLTRSRELTERSSSAVRHCINLQETVGLSTRLKEDMHRASKRILADLEYDISFEGEEILKQLKPQRRTDLFLFYKESLVNISRHSGATRFSTRLAATRKGILLTVTDNGRGLPVSDENGIPPSLKRRARLLGAKVSARPSASGGTCITLKVRPSRLGFGR